MHLRESAALQACECRFRKEDFGFSDDHSRNALTIFPSKETSEIKAHLTNQKDKV